VAYETYGDPGAPAVFVCHALTGDAQAAVWWDTLVGPGKPVDTERFFVICPNLLGGCRGTTGPSSSDPATGNAYGLDFPPLAIADLVAVHRRLLQHLGIERLHTAIGGSMGGMQVLQWLLEDHAQLERAVMICASPRLTAQNLALSHVARRAILDDPDFHQGQYQRHGTKPTRGLATARRLAHVTYLSEDGMARKFDRSEPDGPPAQDAATWLAPQYDVESYLEHQASIFLDRFDALSYLYLTRVMDAFDPFNNGAWSEPALTSATTRAQVIAFSSDGRFGPEHSVAVRRGLRKAGLRTVESHVVASPWGHDSFLLDLPDYLDRVRAFVNRW
jgi:homoserine O-acetyltransferase